ncbi:hypothetical protein K504DRAFT_475337 [Pleomassaria siparia CBS 279.74]|uniref:Zn(2)-C6 fungal-type domain-containing protein n=1 Tax=Pleomassaria siparia CBS 279.74 TaxID=1314801 RepID=A0A6G1KFA1_9PLEO|nr:hypothetical protein K504DRAFT_475337 [Pleomassaria siparia CBS 279.74]
MVYTGKPSKGCQMCKSRRIKCDEGRPTCGQCQKSHRNCPGYQSEFDLMFRDETKAMAKKVKKASTSSTNSTGSQGSPSDRSSSSGLESSPSTSPLFSRSHTSTTTTISTTSPTQNQLMFMPSYETSPVPVPVPLDEDALQTFMWNLEQPVPVALSFPPEFEAVPFFFKNFVDLPQQVESMRGYLELVLPLYKQAQPSSALHLASNSVALATVCNYPGKQHLRRDATRMYGKALRKLNDELKEPIDGAGPGKTDESILAILLFSLYETIMSTDDTIDAWENHVDGAVALTKLRGTDQFKTSMSRAVFRAVRTMMITSCVRRAKPVEPFPGIHGWTVNDGEDNAANRLTVICMDLPSIRARANALTQTPYDPSHESEAIKILEFTQVVDSNLLQWYQTLPSDWHYQTVGMVYEMPEDVAEAGEWPGPQHSYYDVPLASIVNDYRVCRIFCNRVIIACATWLGPGSDYPVTQAYNTALFVIQQVVDEISASVPFHIVYDMQPIPKERGQEKGAAEAFGGYSLVWPLYVAANAETIPQRQRDWLSGRLRVIGTKFGLSEAQVLVLARRHVLTCGPMFP